MPLKSLAFRRGTVNLTKVECVMFLFKQRRLTFVHFKYSQLLSAGKGNGHHAGEKKTLGHTDSRKHNAAVLVPHVQHVFLISNLFFQHKTIVSLREKHVCSSK